MLLVLFTSASRKTQGLHLGMLLIWQVDSAEANAVTPQACGVHIIKLLQDKYRSTWAHAEEG